MTNFYEILRRLLLRITLVFFAVLLFGCTQPTPTPTTSTITISNRTFTVEIANSPEERAQGLMFRESLPADHGMLFVYAEPQQVSFWMKNTLIPLDLLYFDAEQKLIQIFADTPICRPEPFDSLMTDSAKGCPTYPSQLPAQYILELSAGTADQIGVKIGDKLDFLSPTL